MTQPIYVRHITFMVILTCTTIFADEHRIDSRLIIGFEESAYLSMGGAPEVVKYINHHWGNTQPITLIRPMGNAGILVAIKITDEASLNKVIKELLRIKHVRYVNKDQLSMPFHAPDISTPLTP